MAGVCSGYQPRTLTGSSNHAIPCPVGPMAEWLRTGLQIRLRRFDSGSGLHRFLPSEHSVDITAAVADQHHACRVRCANFRNGPS